MGRIEAVVFDIGNVLISWNPCNLYRKMGFEDEQTRAILTETGLIEINHRQLDAGAPYRETIEALAAKFTQYSDFILAFDTRWTEMLAGAIEPSVAVFEDLKQRGVPVYGLSNFSRHKFDISRQLFPFLEHFDELVVSGDIGMVKPDLEIFEYLLEHCDLNPARALFIDDSHENVATAQRIGFDTVLFDQDRSDLQAELSRRRFLK